MSSFWLTRKERISVCLLVYVRLRRLCYIVKQITLLNKRGNSLMKSYKFVVVTRLVRSVWKKGLVLGWSLINIEPQHEISNNVVCATKKGSDQPAHKRSLIRAFASRFNIL